MARHAIIIGCEEYETGSPARYALADADLVHETLTKFCDYAGQNVLLLKLQPSDSESPKSILDQIEKVADRSAPGDTVFFYFAGHGTVVSEVPYLVLPNSTPADYERTALPLRDVTARLRTDGRICIRIFDCCHSGADVRGHSETTAFIRALREPLFDRYGYVTFAACGEDQSSYGDSEIGHGVFTHYLCNYIRSVKAREDVIAALLGDDIAEKVQAHVASRFRLTQTPTSISFMRGRIALATRIEAAAVPPEERSADTSDLAQRIKAIHECQDLREPKRLEGLLSDLQAATEAALESIPHNDWKLEYSKPLYIDEIDSSLVEELLKLRMEHGARPRHTLEVVEEEYDNPADLFDSTYRMLLQCGYQQRPKRKRYVAWQDRELPKSAVVVEMKGDDLCVPDAKILLYVLPLQLTACLILAVYSHRWAPSNSLNLVRWGERVLRPSVGNTNQATGMVRPVLDKALQELKNMIRLRVNELEREVVGRPN